MVASLWGVKEKSAQELHVVCDLAPGQMESRNGGAG